MEVAMDSSVLTCALDGCRVLPGRVGRRGGVRGWQRPAGGALLRQRLWHAADRLRRAGDRLPGGGVVRAGVRRGTLRTYRAGIQHVSYTHLRAHETVLDLVC